VFLNILIVTNLINKFEFNFILKTNNMKDQKFEQLLRSAFASGFMTCNYMDNCKHLKLSDDFGEESFQKFLKDNKQFISKLKESIS